MILAHKIALDPTAKQRKAFAMASGCARFAYNWGLSWWGNTYRSGGKPTALRAKKAFNQIKHREFPWISLSPKDANQAAFENLGNAYGRFFKKLGRYPTYKKKGHSKDSFGVSNDKFKLDGQKIRLPKIGWVRMTEDLRFSGKIMSATVSRTADRWFVSIQVKTTPLLNAKTKRSVVGVDIGLKKAVVVSDGTMFDAPKPLKKHLRRLNVLQRSLARKQKGSNRRKVAKMKVARLHARIACIRLDFLHKVTTVLAKQHSVVCIEDLHVKGMLRNHKLARALVDVGFGEFRRQLEYKSRLHGFELVTANRWFSSTQICSKCGQQRKAKLTLADRVFVCEDKDCGGVFDRDLNAAINLSTLGLRGSYAQGQNVRPLPRTGKAILDELRTNPCS